MALKKNKVWFVFSIQGLPRPKIALLNVGIHQFSSSKRLIHSKMHLKRSLCIDFKENPLSHFSLRESLSKPFSGFSICIFGDIKRWIFFTKAYFNIFILQNNEINISFRSTKACFVYRSQNFMLWVKLVNVWIDFQLLYTYYS